MSKVLINSQGKVITLNGDAILKPEEKWQRPSGWPDLDSLTIPNSFVGSYSTIINYDTTTSYTLIVYGSDATTIELGHISNGTYIVDSTIPLEGTGYLRTATITFTGVKVLRITSTKAAVEYSVGALPIYEVLAYNSLSTGLANSPVLARSAKYKSFKKTNMAYAFSNLTYLENVDIDWAVQPAAITQMFIRCNNLKYINGIKNLSYTSTVTSIHEMFYECKAINTIDISGFDMTNISTISNAFTSCERLHELYPPNSLPASFTLAGSPMLSHDSITRIINSLTTTSGLTLTLHANTKLLLTDNDKATIAAKGWTIA